MKADKFSLPIPSATIGVNLNHELKPVDVILRSVTENPFKGGCLLDRLVAEKPLGTYPGHWFIKFSALSGW